MGDNRNNSQDSRSFGSVPLETVTDNHAWVWWEGG